MTEERDPIDEAFADGRAIDQALKEAVQEALWRHKRLGQSVVVWENGQVVVIPPEEIPVDELPPPLQNGRNGTIGNET